MHTQLMSFAKDWMTKHKLAARLTPDQGEYLLAAFTSDALGIEATADRAEIKGCVDGMLNISALNQALERHGVIAKSSKEERKDAVIAELLS